MKITIHDNGATATINRVLLESGPCRWRFSIDIKEKHRCKKATIGGGNNEFLVFFVGNEPDEWPVEKGPFRHTCLHVEAESEHERRVLNDWTLLTDPGKYELRLWLVAPLPLTLSEEKYGVLFHREEATCDSPVKIKDTAGRYMLAWERLLSDLEKTPLSEWSCSAVREEALELARMRVKSLQKET